jgi:hypothetical protein
MDDRQANDMAKIDQPNHLSGKSGNTPHPCTRYAQHRAAEYTLVCLDILKKILAESRKANGQRPCRRT